MKKHVFTILMSFVLLGISQCMSRADMASLSNYVNSINSQNGGNGLALTYQYSSGVEFRVTMGANSQQLDLSAYSSLTSGSNTFQSFCAESSAGVYTNTALNGKLSLVGNNSYNTSSKALSVGSAYLYKLFATGDLLNYNYANSATNASTLRSSLWAAMGSTTVADWSTDAYLSQLLAVNSDKNFWLSTYDASQRYDFIGDYTVLLLGCTTTTGANTQDVFYLMNGSGGSASAPEPATLALWAIGGMLPIGYKMRNKMWKKRNTQ
ncbi:MAG: hypothetical protein FWC50_11625 [Planctomycetaceae bacterium]|nr:hypothetical protein [Planctomycetaceae bacterium]